MKHAHRLVLIIWSITTFILVLFLSLVPMIFNNNFYQKVWQSAGTYEEMNISEEELTKVIDHTMDYLWGRNDDLQIQVTLNDGTVRDFYVNWGVDKYTGKEMDELGHMADCKVLFMAGKNLSIISLIVWLMSTCALILERKNLNRKLLNTTYYTYGAIIVGMGIIAVAALLNFNQAFEIFHKIFFSNSNISWTYPAQSFMIRMLPEQEIFAEIVYRTLIKAFFCITIVLAITSANSEKNFIRVL